MMADTTDDVKAEKPKLAELITAQCTNSDCLTTFLYVRKPDTRFNVWRDRVLVKSFLLGNVLWWVLPASFSLNFFPLCHWYLPSRHLASIASTNQRETNCTGLVWLINHTSHYVAAVLYAKQYARQKTTEASTALLRSLARIFRYEHARNLAKDDAEQPICGCNDGLLHLTHWGDNELRNVYQLNCPHLSYVLDHNNLYSVKAIYQQRSSIWVGVFCGWEYHTKGEWDEQQWVAPKINGQAERFNCILILQLRHYASKQ